MEDSKYTSKLQSQRELNLKKVNTAISNLESLKQQILDLHYGIASGLPLSYQEIASILSRTSSPELILQFASSHQGDDNKIVFSTEDIKFLEAQALRELARPARRKVL